MNDVDAGSAGYRVDSSPLDVDRVASIASVNRVVVRPTGQRVISGAANHAVRATGREKGDALHDDRVISVSAHCCARVAGGPSDDRVGAVTSVQGGNSADVRREVDGVAPAAAERRCVPGETAGVDDVVARTTVSDLPTLTVRRDVVGATLAIDNGVGAERIGHNCF